VLFIVVHGVWLCWICSNKFSSFYFYQNWISSVVLFRTTRLFTKWVNQAIQFHIFQVFRGNWLHVPWKKRPNIPIQRYPIQRFISHQNNVPAHRADTTRHPVWSRPDLDHSSRPQTWLFSQKFNTSKGTMIFTLGELTHTTQSDTSVRCRLISEGKNSNGWNGTTSALSVVAIKKCWLVT
jgi:hypothetical protein